MLPAIAALTLIQAAWTPQKVLDLYNDPRDVMPNVSKELAAWFGEKALAQGAEPKVDNVTVAWALRTEGQNPEVTSIPAGFRLKLKLVGDHLYAGAAKLHDGDGFRWTYQVDGKPVGAVRDLEVYEWPPESKPDTTIPQGKLEKQAPLTSKTFGGTIHDWWIYTPANLKPDQECALMVFQDGQWTSGFAPLYMDHLIAKGEMPPTIGVFVTPGTFPDGKSDRSHEYDTLSGDYPKFLLEEILPPVEAKYKISQDPMKRGSCGLSSGGICAFTCAWERPDKFGLVLSAVGSFTNIASGSTLKEGGHNYQALIRKSPKRPIRVFLQEGENDLDNVHGNWPLANHAMEKSLQFAKYDVKTSWGQGFHSDKGLRRVLADALRWLFRD
jgi:enterochelin esterase family protein